MADNWSPSFLTLSNPGDWAKWTVTVPDLATADDLNGVGDFALCLSRGALTAASRSALVAATVNDIIAISDGNVFAMEAISSTGAWVSADRFKDGFAFGSVLLLHFGTVDFTNRFGHPNSVPIGGLTPWVVGANTLRIISWGRNTDPSVSEPVEIDFVELITGSDPGGFNLGTESVAEPIPPNFTAHSNPDPLPAANGHLWVLGNADVTTGTAAAAQLDVIKLCPVGSGNRIATIRVTGSGSPVAGTVGVRGGSDFLFFTTTLNGAGEATFVVADGQGLTFWYGGNDQWAPTDTEVGLEEINCNAGWYLQQIGMSI